ncbi:MAG: protein-export chaperone SecB [Agarilytica sp.]
MTEEKTEAAESQEQAAKNQFALQRIYLKDVSFESPMGINARSNAKPALTQDLHTKVDKVGDNHYEVVLHLTITVKQEENVMFLVEVHQAGLFFISGLNTEQVKQVVSSTCPSILFPYARETVDSLAVRGGFQPLMLPPVNFEGLYAKSIADAKKAEEQAGASTEVH